MFFSFCDKKIKYFIKMHVAYALLHYFAYYELGMVWLTHNNTRSTSRSRNTIYALFYSVVFSFNFDNIPMIWLHTCYTIKREQEIIYGRNIQYFRSELKHTFNLHKKFPIKPVQLQFKIDATWKKNSFFGATGRLVLQRKNGCFH